MVYFFYLRIDPSPEKLPIKNQIFQKMNLISSFPLVARRMDFERMKRGINELPSAFMKRMFSCLFSSQMDTAPPVARVLVKIITLQTDTLNKSVKEHLIKVMRENPNIDKKEEVMTYIYALESDDRINQVEELVDCKVCGKKHKKRNCFYMCCHCGMLGSHKSDKCVKAFPQLRQGKGDKRDRERGDRSKSRSLSRGRKPRYGDRGKDDRQKPNTWRVGDREKSESHTREDDYQQDRDREGGRQKRLPTPGARDREVEHTRRFKPR